MYAILKIQICFLKIFLSVEKIFQLKSNIYFSFFFQVFEILPSTLQSHLIFGVVVVTALVLVTSSFVWCAFYLMIKCCKSCKSCKRCSREERETEEGIEMAEQQQQQQPEKKREGGGRTLSHSLPREPKNSASGETQNGEKFLCFN